MLRFAIGDKVTILHRKNWLFDAKRTNAVLEDGKVWIFTVIVQTMNIYKWLVELPRGSRELHKTITLRAVAEPGEQMQGASEVEQQKPSASGRGRGRACGWGRGKGRPVAAAE